MTDDSCPAPIPLSNRRGIGSLNEPRVSHGVGVDRLSLSFPVYSYAHEVEAWTKISEVAPGREGAERTFSTSVPVPTPTGEVVQAFVGVREGPGGVRGKVEFNPARLRDPEGFSLAPAGEVVALADLVLSTVADAGYVSSASSELVDFHVKRIDVARDFDGVSSASALIRGLAPISRPYSRRNLVHADPARHGAQTLMVGSGAGIVRLYDKSAEVSRRTGSPIPDGLLRWEVESRPEWSSNYGGIRSLEDVSRAKVEDLATNRWEWSAMGVEVTSTAGVVEVLARRSGLTERERNTFLGWLVQQGTPYAYQPAKATLAKFRRLQRELGVAVGPEALGSVGFVSRLDWESGTEVCRVA